MILLQALNSITGDGGISADWTLNGVVGALVILVAWVFINTLNTIKNEIKAIHKRVDTRQEEHDELADKHNQLDKKVHAIERNPAIDTTKLAEEMINKMRAASGGGKSLKF